MTTAALEDTDPLTTQWTLFLQDYARGNERSPPFHLPSWSSQDAIPPLPSFQVPLYPPGEVTPETARMIAQFYKQYRFLPPPPSDEEYTRRRTIEEYNLFRQDQIENFQRCISLVSSIFPFAPVCIISLFQNDVQVIVSKSGEFPVRLGEALVTETSICGHVVLKKNGEPTELVELGNDWRFIGNPWCGAAGGTRQGYVGVPITLDVDPSNPRPSERITVGVLALMWQQPIPKLTDTQRKVLHDISAMLGVQLRSTWEGWRGGKETKMRNAVSLFLEGALVEPSQQAITDAAVAIADPLVQGTPHPSRSAMRGSAANLFSTLCANAAEQICKLLEAEFAIIIDLSSFHATQTNTAQRSHSWMMSDQESQTRLSQRILACCSAPVCSGLEANFATPAAMMAIAGFLDMSVTTGRSVFPAPWTHSGLENLLSLPRERGKNYTVPHIALPFYTAQQPKLLIVVASAAPLFTFNQSDVTFARNVGLVLVARTAQNAVVEANAAKTAFVSQMSHELRTPLHGLLGHLDLLRDRFSSGELSTVPALLDSAEYCGTALRDIVDDVLDYGKMSRADGSGASSPRHTAVDLLQITVEASRSCWIRRQQGQSATASGSTADAKSAVELIVEWEDRSMLKGWWIRLDVPGFIRILNNLVANSLKYTADGIITVTLVSGRGRDNDGNETRHIILRCEDSGRGIAPDFMDQIFDPFTQADSFSPGAGLGLHITKSIVDRMGGTITVESVPGSGTIVTVVLPIEELELGPPDTTRFMQRIVMSSEVTPPPSPPPYLNGSNDTSAVQICPPSKVTTPRYKSVSECEDQPHLTILVVDDNAISRKILVTISQRLNATAHQAEDGLSALEVFRQVHPQVVWTDVSMPRMDGVTAAKEMRAIEREMGWPASHIVAITGLGMSDEHIRREALVSPAALDGWLVKGQINMKSLRESLVALRRKLREPAL
ncbi:hypothetical protein GGX14DRAFT_450013, partial [Mycena pura]